MAAWVRGQPKAGASHTTDYNTYARRKSSAVTSACFRNGRNGALRQVSRVIGNGGSMSSNRVPPNLVAAASMPVKCKSQPSQFRRADPSDTYGNIQLNDIHIHRVQAIRQRVAMFPTGFNQFPCHILSDFNRFSHCSPLGHQAGELLGGGQVLTVFYSSDLKMKPILLRHFLLLSLPPWSLGRTKVLAGMNSRKRYSKSRLACETMWGSVRATTVRSGRGRSAPDALGDRGCLQCAEEAVGVCRRDPTRAISLPGNGLSQEMEVPLFPAYPVG